MTVKQRQAVAGLDVGTGAIKLAFYGEGDTVKTAVMRNVFYEISPKENQAMLKRLTTPVFEVAGKTYLAGEDAYELAVMFAKPLRRPMADGVLNVGNESTVAVAMIGVMIQRLLKETGLLTGRVVYSCPAAPVDVDLDAVVHRTLVEQQIRRAGWEPESIEEGYGVVLSELADDDFTGIGLSFGAGMVNACFAFRAMPMITFSSCRSGDWIDARVADRLKIERSQAMSIKEETTFNCHHPLQTNLEHMIVAAYYREMIEYALGYIGKRFQDQSDAPRLRHPVRIACAGGTSMVAGFSELFQEIVGRISLPFKISSVKMAADPVFAVSRGCLIQSSLQ